MKRVHRTFWTYTCGPNFQFPFIGIFRWNQSTVLVAFRPLVSLSIPFYWDFPLKHAKQVFEMLRGLLLSIPFYWDFPLKLRLRIGFTRGLKVNFQFPFIGIFRWNTRGSLIQVAIRPISFQFPFIGIFRWNKQLLPDSPQPCLLLSIPFYWDFPLKHIWLSGPEAESSDSFQFPFIGIFRWNLHSSLQSATKKNSNFQFPFIGIFRWNWLFLAVWFPWMFQLSIPFYWDFPLKLRPLYTLKSVYPTTLSIPFYWDFPLKLSYLIEWIHGFRIILSIPFYWDFPLKPSTISLARFLS